MVHILMCAMYIIAHICNLIIIWKCVGQERSQALLMYWLSPMQLYPCLRAIYGLLAYKYYWSVFHHWLAL